MSSNLKPPPVAAEAVEEPPASPKPTTTTTLESGEEPAPQIWLQGDEGGWELTWPIWHMLPRDERKALAIQHGCKTIGEFEDYMTLQRGITDSTTVSQPYENNLVYPEYHPTTTTGDDKHGDEKIPAPPTIIPEEDIDSEDEELEEAIRSQQREAEERLTSQELMKVGGKILLLPDDLLHKVFAWLPVDSYATLALVSPHWKAFTRTEAVYKRLCERLYLVQSQRKALHVHRFNNSYRTMLEKRPRVRAGGGVYVMKYSRVKPVQRDMWTEIPHGAILEMVYYRYLYFQEDGRVIYALTPTGPHEMFRRFRKMCLHLEEHKYTDPVAVWGTYEVQKTHVTVKARQSWQYVKIDLSIQPQYRLHGRWGYLSFDSHQTSPSGCFEDWSQDRIEFDVPEEPFRFVKDRRL